MDITERAELAVAYKHQGSNCCQAVLLAFADLLAVPEEVLRQMGAGFGTGMGTLEATCGALCGAQLVMGLRQRWPTPVPARRLYGIFRELCGSAVCKELKGAETGRMLCSCDDCVRNAVNALAQVLPERL